MRRTLLALAAIFLLVSSAHHRAVAPVAPPRLIAGPTFDKEVVRIFQDHCQTCHHPGDIAPFSLMTYADAAPHADAIKYMTSTHQMPPWKPVNGCGEFVNADTRTLPQSDIDTIAQWVENGAPEGNAADLPPAKDFAGGWALGQPDLVLSYPQSYTPPVANGDTYRCFPVPTNIGDDTYVSAIDIKPGDRATVHHVIAYIDTNGDSAKLDDADPGPGYTCFGGPGFAITNPDSATLGGWAPGARPIVVPDGVAYKLAANSRVVLQVHYHPHGPVNADTTQIGIYFAKQKPKQLLRILPLINQTFTIPPGDPHYKVTAQLPIQLPVAAHLWVIAPHMHLLGRSMQVTATTRSASTCLINIDDWDFNWQGLYLYKDAVPLPVGTALQATAYYDNSAENWRNPNDPPKPVSWGEQTTDEMCIAFLGVTLDSENLLTGQTADASWIPPLTTR